MAALNITPLTAHLLLRIREVRANVGNDAAVREDGDMRFANLLDSMGLVEFLLLVADDCGVAPERIEECVQRQFGSVGELATRMQAAGLTLRTSAKEPASAEVAPRARADSTPCISLAATAVRLPKAVEHAAELDELLGRPRGWYARHSGIRQRHVWRGEEPLTAAADAARDCLAQADIGPKEIGALLVTSEAPPRLIGLAAALHHCLELPSDAVALEIGGACSGFVAALWLARQLQLLRAAVLIVAVEAPTRYLEVQPGAAGEAAALFGDAAAACLLTAHSSRSRAWRVRDVLLAADGSGADLIQVEPNAQRSIEVRLQGEALAIRAVETLAQAVRLLLEKNGLGLADVEALVVHGGNGRLPRLVARNLGLTPERIWSETASTGNLGSASLPAAWVAGRPAGSRAVWATVGAGLTWGAALLDAASEPSGT